MKLLNLSFVLAVTLFVGLVGNAAPDEKGTRSALEVITRFTGEVDPAVELNLIPIEDADIFSTKVVDGKLVIVGTSPLALTRGFYVATKAQKRGLNDWAGNRFASGPWTKDAEVKGMPVKDYRPSFTEVVHARQVAKWTWEQWSRELDYLALHGYNAPKAIVAKDAILARVNKKRGVSEEPSAETLVAYAEQIALQHKILTRMRSLKMKICCPTGEDLDESFADAWSAEFGTCDRVGETEEEGVKPDLGTCDAMTLERLSDEAWQKEKIDSDDFSRNYLFLRYGAEISPQEPFEKYAAELGQNPLYRADLIVYTTEYVRAIIDKLMSAEGEHGKEIERLRLTTERLLAAHPYLALELKTKDGIPAKAVSDPLAGSLRLLKVANKLAPLAEKTEL